MLPITAEEFIVLRDSFFYFLSLSVNPCPMLIAIVLQLFPPREHLEFVAAKILLQR